MALTVCVHLAGRVCRRRLRELLLQRCKASGVQFRAGEVARIQNVDDDAECVTLTLSDRTAVRSRQAQLSPTGILCTGVCSSQELASLPLDLAGWCISSIALHAALQPCMLRLAKGLEQFLILTSRHGIISLKHSPSIAPLPAISAMTDNQIYRLMPCHSIT